MFVRTLEELRAAGAEKVLAEGRVRSVRFLTQRDGMGFTLTDVRVQPGAAAEMWYKRHWEANYIVGGAGALTDLAGGERWPLAPGTLYTVGPAGSPPRRTLRSAPRRQRLQPAAAGRREPRRRRGPIRRPSRRRPARRAGACS